MDAACLQVDFLINRLNALEEHMKSAEDQLALELDYRWVASSDSIQQLHQMQASS